MNIKRFCFAATSFIAFLFFSCSDIANFSIPKSVTVKSSNASYSVPLGSVEFNISDKLSVSELQNKIGDTAEIYDFNAGGADTVQEYLINYPISSIPIDFSSYLDNLDLLSQSSEAQSWTVTEESPSVSFEKDIETNLDDQVNSSFESGNIDLFVPEVGSGNSVSTSTLGSGNGLSITMTISSPTFSTMEYYSGSINIVITAPTSPAPTTGFSFTVKAIIKDGETEIANSGEAQDVANGGTLSISLAGVTLTPSFTIVFDGTLSGGTLLKTNSYSVSSNISSDAKIKEVTGLTISNDDLGSSGIISVDEEIDTSSLSSYLISATIAEGTASYYAVLPTGWSGVTCSSTVGLSGGMAIASSKFSDVTDTSKNYLINKTANLADSTITPQTTTLAGNVELLLSNATITFPESGTLSISIVGSCSITKLGKTTVNVGNLVDTSELSQSVSQELPDEVKTYLKSIVFAPDGDTPALGITGTVDSNLDVKDMTLTVGVTSTMFNMDSGTNKDSLDLSNLATDNSFTIKKTDSVTVTPSTNSTADISAEVSITGSDYSEHSEYVTFNSFEFGKEYYITPSFEVSYNWSTVTLNTSGLAQEDTISTGLDLNSILDSFLSEDDSTLLDNVEFNNIEAYLYVKEPEFTSSGDVTTNPLSNITLNGTVHAVSCTLDDDNNVLTTTNITNISGEDIGYLIGSASKKESLSLVSDSSAVDFAALSAANTDGIITSKKAVLFNDGSADISEKNYSAKLDNLTSVINAKPKNLGIDYSIILADSEGDAELTLTKAQVDTLTSSSGTASISMSVAIVFPLSFTVTAAIEDVDILSLSDNEITDDLLNRDSAGDSSDWQKYADLVKSITLNYKFNNSTGLSFSASFKDTESGIDKTLVCNDSTNKITFSNENINSIFNNYPFTPTVLMTIDAGEVSVPRDAMFGVSATLTAVTDGEYTIWGDAE